MGNGVCSFRATAPNTATKTSSKSSTSCTACTPPPSMGISVHAVLRGSGQRHEAYLHQPALLQASRGVPAPELQLLLFRRRTDRQDEPAARRELVEQRGRHLPRRGGDEDSVER